MVTYLYWFLLFVLAFGLLIGLGVKFGSWRAGMVSALVVLGGGTVGYYGYLEQVFVKRYGGTMSITQEENLLHVGMTWKDDNLWVESWDPKTNECVFTEYARSGLLQGSVVIANCNPVAARMVVPAAAPPATP